MPIVNPAKWFYDAMYRFTRPDWDSGVTPPELAAMIEKIDCPGSVLELGCGTGTNSIFLAQHGWQVVGIDFSPKAIELARHKAQTAEVPIEFWMGDVTRLDFLHDPFDLALDVSCFHGLSPEDKVRYTHEVTRLTHLHSKLLLHAFAQPAFLGIYGLTEDAARRIFAPYFHLIRVQHGQGRHQRDTVWYEFEREYNVTQA